MAERIIMPKQGLQMTEGTIIKWMFGEGDRVEAGEPLFEMETDKLTIVIDSPSSGTLLKIIKENGETVPITELIAIIGEPNEDVAELLAETDTTESQGTPATPSAEIKPDVTALPDEPTQSGRVFISPRAKTLAGELGIDYTAIAGSAPDGMIIERDIIAAKSIKSSVKSVTGESGQLHDIVPMKGMRKIIAERMKLSLSVNAQAVHRVSVRMGEIVGLREALDKKVGYNDLIAYATVKALQEFKAINAEQTDEGIIHKRYVNLGIAVAMEDGLIVPVVKNAHLLSLLELSAEIKRLAEKAREGKLTVDESTGGSFTISNLGMYGLEEFVAIINPPESGILAVGAIEDTPVVINGVIEIHPVMKLTLSYDHRVIDGAPAALFLTRIKKFLEQPYLM